MGSIVENLDFQKVLAFLGDAWNFQIIKVDNNFITVGSVIIGVVFLIVGVTISKIISRRITKVIGQKSKIDRNVLYIIQAILFYFLAAFALLIAMKFAQLPLTIFTALGGALAIGVGFGSQNLVNNFLSGIILMVEQPIKIGDYIEVDNLFGEVESIGMRSTNILSYGNRHIIVPNSSFLERNVLNWTHLDNVVRVNVTVGVAYGSDTAKVKELLLQAAKEESAVVESPPAHVYFTEFADNTLNFRLNCGIKIRKLDDRERVKSNLRFSIDRLFRAHDVVIAFPQRDLHLMTEKPIEVQLAKD